MAFPTASTDFAQAKLQCSPTWKTACEASVKTMGLGIFEVRFHLARRLAWERDFDIQCGHSIPSRKRKYDEAFGKDNTSRESTAVSRVRIREGDVGVSLHSSIITSSSAATPQYNERISEQRQYGAPSSPYVFNALEYNPNEEQDPAGELFDEDDSDDSDEELYDDDFEYEPPNYHPEWTRTMSPPLDPSRHSTPPEVMKWVYWPPIYESLEQTCLNIGARFPLLETVCIKAAMAHINFVDLSAYRFPYGAMGRARPLPQRSARPRYPRHVQTPSPLRQVEECTYSDGT